MIKMEEETYKVLRGMKTLKRHHRKEGESKWYYLDPRGARTIADMGEIDVENEHAPNPYAREILIDDMRRHEEDYYVWRTMEDEKVRESHASRDGKVYNWNLPPVGGNPGEDYNCRCWAEEFDFKKMKDADMVDLLAESGADLTDEELYDRMWENIRRFEDITRYPYLDTKGLITIGAGANVNNLDNFLELKLTINGFSATMAQKLEAYQYLRWLSEQKDEKGNFINHNRRAHSFEKETNVRISDIEIRQLAQKHMTKDLEHLRKEFTDFDEFPLPLKEVLLDIQYNVKGGIDERKWPKLYKAIRQKNVLGKDGIAENMYRPDVQKNRNDWAKEMVHSIKF